MRSATAASLAFLLIAPISVFPNLAAAQTQDTSSTIDDSDSIFIDGRTFRITPGKGKSDALWAIKGLGARELDPGASCSVRAGSFTSSMRPCIFRGRIPPIAPASWSARTNRIRIEYVPPENRDHQY